MELHVAMVYTSFEFGDELHLSSFTLISFFSPSLLPAKILRDFIDLAIVLSLLGARMSNIDVLIESLLKIVPFIFLLSWNNRLNVNHEHS